MKLESGQPKRIVNLTVLCTFIFLITNSIFPQEVGKWRQQSIRVTVLGGLEEESLSVRSAYFTNEKEGVIVGSAGGVRVSDSFGFYGTTKDAGINWKISSRGRSSMNDVMFVTQRNGWLVGTETPGLEKRASGFLLVTKDAGSNWKKHVPSVGLDDYYLSSVYFINTDRGFMVGGFNKNGRDMSAIFRSEDGGESWARVYQGEGEGSLSYGSRIKFDKSGVFGIALGRGEGELIITRDGGNTWKSQLTDYSDVRPFLNIEIVSNSEAWITTDAGSLMHTVNGGRNWKQRDILPSDANTKMLLDKTVLSFTGITFRNRLQGWICGNDGLILATQNGGKTWSAENYEPNTYLKKLQKVDTKLIALGDGPIVLYRGLKGR